MSFLARLKAMALQTAALLTDWKHLWTCHKCGTWLCEDCQRRRDAAMSYDREIDKLAWEDPERASGHSYATETEARQHWIEVAPYRNISMETVGTAWRDPHEIEPTEHEIRTESQ